MTYPALLKKLQNNHYYPSILITVKKNEEVITGLEIYTSPLLKENNLARVKEVIGEDFQASYQSTNQSIRITKA